MFSLICRGDSGGGELEVEVATVVAGAARHTWVPVWLKNGLPPFPVETNSTMNDLRALNRSHSISSTCE